MPPTTINITKKGFRCERCGHEWVPEDINKPPKNCPNKQCKSPYWDRPRQRGV